VGEFIHPLHSIEPADRTGCAAMHLSSSTL
jgi:hypothetical protein